MGSLWATTRRLGRFSHFVVYTGKLNWFVPAPAITALAWIATATETALDVALLLGVFPRLIAALTRSEKWFMRQLVVEISGYGPTDTRYFDPNNDPSHK